MNIINQPARQNDVDGKDSIHSSCKVCLLATAGQNSQHIGLTWLPNSSGLKSSVLDSCADMMTTRQEVEQNDYCISNAQILTTPAMIFKIEDTIPIYKTLATCSIE